MPQLILKTQLPDTVIQSVIARARAATLIRAIQRGVINVGGKAVLREAEPDTDFGLAQRRWVTGALVVATVANYINARLAVNKVACFYAVYAQDAAPVVSGVRFQQGAGTSLAAIEIESMYTALEPQGFFDPILYDPNDMVTVTVYPRLTKAAPGDALVLGCLICEPPGEVESRPNVDPVPSIEELSSIASRFM